MSATLVLLWIGSLLLASLVYLLFRPGAESDDDSCLHDGNSALPSARFADRRKEQLERIFGREDWDFIRGSTSEQVQRLFLRERKVIALAWISELRRQAKSGMHLHVARARTSKELQPVVEIKLAVDYYAFLAKCGLIAAIVLLGGPMALRGMVGQAGSLSDNLRGMLDAALKPEAFSQKTGIR
jgi:hypothetical protein